VDEHWLPSNSLWLKVEREPASSVMPEGAKAFCKDRGVTIAEEEDPDLMALWAPRATRTCRMTWWPHWRTCFFYIHRGLGDEDMEDSEKN
jgi:hypothetical protein